MPRCACSGGRRQRPAAGAQVEGLGLDLAGGQLVEAVDVGAVESLRSCGSSASVLFELDAHVAGQDLVLGELEEILAGRSPAARAGCRRGRRGAPGRRGPPARASAWTARWERARRVRRCSGQRCPLHAPEGRVGRVCIVAPTTHIARQWAADAARYGLDIEPNRPNAAGPEPSDRHGVAVTYQTLAAGPKVHRRALRRGPTLLLADEPHHMGDQAAGAAACRRRSSRRRLPPAALRHAVPLRQHADPVDQPTTRTASRAPTSPTATPTPCSTAFAAL